MGICWQKGVAQGFGFSFNQMLHVSTWGLAVLLSAGCSKSYLCVTFSGVFVRFLSLSYVGVQEHKDLKLLWGVYSFTEE